MSESLNAVGIETFRCVNSSARCLGTNASILCSSSSSWLQQRAFNPKFHDSIDQINVLKFLKRNGASSSSGRTKILKLTYRCFYLQNPVNKTIRPVILSCQSSFWIYELILCISYSILDFEQVKCSIKSVTPAEKLATGEATYEGQVLVKAIQELLCTELKTVIVVDLKDLFTTLSVYRLASDKCRVFVEI